MFCVILFGKMMIQGRSEMTDSIILSEKPEDNIAAMEWGIKQGELMRKGEEITKRLNEKYTPIILEMERKRKENNVR